MEDNSAERFLISDTESSLGSSERGADTIVEGAASIKVVVVVDIIVDDDDDDEVLLRFDEEDWGFLSSSFSLLFFQNHMFFLVSEAQIYDQ